MQIPLNEDLIRVLLTVAFGVTAICSKLLLNSFFQGINRYWGYRRRKEGWEPMEPESLHKGFAPLGSETLADRLTMVWRNDLENFLPFTLLYLFSALFMMPVNMLQAILAMFLGARFLHTFAALSGMLPVRAISYFLGLLIQIGLIFYVFAIIVFLS